MGPGRTKPADADEWPGGGLPHFASIVVGRVAQVTDETSDADTSPTVDDDEARDELDDEFGDARDDELDDGALAEAEAAMNEARARLAQVPAEVVVTNHVMGLYELAAIHLSSTPADLAQAALAIDAMSCLVDGLGDRLGPDAATMRDALANIRLAYVQIKGQTANDAG